jgi:SOS response regulatory protein OraA/RecX
MPDAYEDGLRLLSRRSLTRREVDDRLRARGHRETEVEAAMARLAGIGAVDDAALARNWIASRVSARGRGRARALASLAARGVDEAVASAAWLAALEDGVVDEDALLARAVRLKLGAKPAPTGKGRLARVYNALLSEGFGREQVEAALAPYGFERTEE